MAQGVPALDKALNIMEYLSKQDDSVTLKKIADFLDIPISTAFRIVKTLVARGYLVELHNGCLTYAMGEKVQQLAYQYNQGLSINSVAKPVMQTLSQQTEQTSQLAIMSGNQIVYVEQVLPKAPISIVAPQHIPIAVNISAGGKAILASMPEKFILQYLETAELAKKTAHSIIAHSALLKELKITTARGYALDYEEFALGVGCIACPIMDYNKSCIGAIGITGHISHYNSPQTLHNLIALVQKAAADISVQYGALVR